MRGFAVPDTANPKNLIIGVDDMDPEDENNYQSEIKIQINNLLWNVLPANATMKEAEEVATITWENIVALREKYKCTGLGS